MSVTFFLLKIIFFKIVALNTLVLVKSIGFDGENLKDSTDIKKIKKFIGDISLKTINDTLNKEIVKNLETLSHIFTHQDHAKRQRDRYKFMKDNLNDDEILIEMDYKQKVSFLINNKKIPVKNSRYCKLRYFSESFKIK